MRPKVWLVEPGRREAPADTFRSSYSPPGADSSSGCPCRGERMRLLLVHPSALMYSEIFLRLEPLGLERV
ncbi:hypothetical protein AB0E00_34265, partial [Streptomyces sp. NPDC048110]|uniref:hypothetical protein n=1 Tax=Streptomyces sp. NPDC048110 TaxID=3155483 RepID=UPI0033F677E3